MYVGINQCVFTIMVLTYVNKVIYGSFFEGSQSVWPNFKPLYSKMYDLFLNEYYQCFGINSWMKSELLTKEKATLERSM